MTASILTATLLVAAAQAQGLANSLPELNNFGWGFPVEPVERASFYRVTLPMEVYESATDAQLRDLAVYNAAGEPVPRIVEAGVAATEEQETTQPLPYAALYRNQTPDADRVRMMFEQMSGGTRIEVSSEPPGDGKIRPPLSGYIADTRALDGAIDALELAWPDSAGGFVGRVSVEGSHDLEAWQLLGGAALADLREQDTAILQNRVSLADDDFDFLRVTWQDLPDDWRLDALTAVQISAAPRLVREVLVLDPSGVDEDTGVREFDAGAALRVDRVRVLPEGGNSVVGVAIDYRVPGSDRWSTAHRGTFYRLERSTTPVTSQAAAIAAPRAAEWRVTVTKGRPDTPLRLELGWRPDTLLFVAEGSGPYTLAVGRPGAADERFPEHRLLGDVSLGGIATDNGPVAEALLGERFGLGGLPREAPPEPIDWRTLLLWTGLVAAVAVVLWMALRLFRNGPG